MTRTTTAKPSSEPGKAPAVPPPPPAPLPADPDLVDRIFDYILADPALAAAIHRVSHEHQRSVDHLKTAVRAEFAGETVRIAKRRPDLPAKVMSLFNGRNAHEIGRTLGISRPTVYRILKQARQP